MELRTSAEEKKMQMEMTHSRSCTSHEVQSDRLHELVSVPGANEVPKIQYEIRDRCLEMMVHRYENCAYEVFKESVRLRSSLEETNKIISRFTEILDIEMYRSRGSITNHEVQLDWLRQNVPGAIEVLEILYEIRDRRSEMVERYENCAYEVFKESVHFRSSLEETNQIISRFTEISDMEMNHSRDGTNHGVQSDWLHRLVSVPRVNEILEKQFEIRDRCLEMIECYENCEDELLQEVVVCARFRLEVTNKIISRFAET